jgi:hypothetical protein
MALEESKHLWHARRHSTPVLSQGSIEDSTNPLIAWEALHSNHHCDFASETIATAAAALLASGAAGGSHLQDLHNSAPPGAPCCPPACTLCAASLSGPTLGEAPAGDPKSRVPSLRGAQPTYVPTAYHRRSAADEQHSGALSSASRLTKTYTDLLTGTSDDEGEEPLTPGMIREPGAGPPWSSTQRLVSPRGAPSRVRSALELTPRARVFPSIAAPPQPPQSPTPCGVTDIHLSLLHDLVADVEDNEWASPPAALNLRAAPRVTEPYATQSNSPGSNTIWYASSGVHQDASPKTYMLSHPAAGSAPLQPATHAAADTALPPRSAATKELPTYMPRPPAGASGGAASGLPGPAKPLSATHLSGGSSTGRKCSTDCQCRQAPAGPVSDGVLGLRRSQSPSAHASFEATPSL